MINEFKKIAELQSVYTEKCELKNKEGELSEPLLTDLQYVPMIFSWFCQLSGVSSSANGKLNRDQKKQFLFIILFLYSPAALAGGRITARVRCAVAKVLQYKAQSGVSNQLETTVSLYYQYKDFKDQVDYLYTEIRKRLKKEGILP